MKLLPVHVAVLRNEAVPDNGLAAYLVAGFELLSVGYIKPNDQGRTSVTHLGQLALENHELREKVASLEAACLTAEGE